MSFSNLESKEEEYRYSMMGVYTRDSISRICPMAKAGNSNPMEMFISASLAMEKNQELAFGTTLSLEFD